MRAAQKDIFTNKACLHEFWKSSLMRFHFLTKSPGYCFHNKTLLGFVEKHFCMSGTTGREFYWYFVNNVSWNGQQGKEVLPIMLPMTILCLGVIFKKYKTFSVLIYS